MITGRALQPFSASRHCLYRPLISCRSVTKVAADEALRTVSSNGEVSCLVITGTRLVEEARRRHNTSPTASAALGRAMLGTLLISIFKAEGETTQISFRGDGILCGIQTIAEAAGQVKGKVGNPQADPPLRLDGKLDVGSAVGKGVLAVVRSHPEWERSYTGIVEIASGEIAEDIAKYLVESEQQNAAIALGVSINRDANIQAAGGYLIQILPFASEETLATLEKNISNCSSMTDMMHQGLDAHQITERLLVDIGSSSGPSSIVPSYGPCEASALKQRMKQAVVSLGPREIKSIIEEKGTVEVTCEFCKETYDFEEEELLTQRRDDLSAN